MSVPTAPRSQFVTALAWIFIVLSGFTTLIAILQNVMMIIMFPMMDMGRMVREDPNVPPAFAVMTSFVPFMFPLFLLVSGVTLASSVGLLFRRNWARVTFIAMMAFGILWQVLGVAFAIWMGSVLPDFIGRGGRQQAEFETHFQAMFYGIMVVNFLMMAAFTFLFAWIIKRLCSPAIRAEFGVA